MSNNHIIFRMLKAAGQPPQRLVRQLSGNLKDKTVGVIGMGHVGK